ncbi:MAG: glutaminase [Rhodothermales bacterium]
MQSTPDYKGILHEIEEEVRPLLSVGRVADYIAPLAAVPLEQFGMTVRTLDGRQFSVGNATRRFSIQSIAKVFNLSVAIEREGDSVWKRVGREPSGNSFNSLVQLELERGIPRNPFINAGALVVLDAVLAHATDAEDLILDFVRSNTGADVGYDVEVAREESRAGYRNRALAHFLKSFDNLQNDPDDVLDAYFRLCSLSMNCEELAAAMYYLASEGLTPQGKRMATRQQTKRVNAVMLTCGVYDEAGDYAYRVGLPAKSGVGGGVVAVMPGEFVAAVWSPGLSPKGNSVAGTMALELLTTKSGLSIF